MATHKTAGTKQLSSALDADLVDEFKVFCDARPESIRWHLELAIRRHLANPPPLPGAPPLPPVTAGGGVPEPEKPAPKGKPAGKRPRGKK